MSPEERGVFWRLEVECHPEDWSNNDLNERASQPGYEMEIVAVARKTVEVWVEVA